MLQRLSSLYFHHLGPFASTVVLFSWFPPSSFTSSSLLCYGCLKLLCLPGFPSKSQEDSLLTLGAHAQLFSWFPPSSFTSSHPFLYSPPQQHHSPLEVGNPPWPMLRLSETSMPPGVSIKIIRGFLVLLVNVLI